MQPETRTQSNRICPIAASLASVQITKTWQGRGQSIGEAIDTRLGATSLRPHPFPNPEPSSLGAVHPWCGQSPESATITRVTMSKSEQLRNCIEVR